MSEGTARHGCRAPSGYMRIGRANRREKTIMDVYIGEDEDGEPLFHDDLILSTNLKKQSVT